MSATTLQVSIDTSASRQTLLDSMHAGFVRLHPNQLEEFNSRLEKLNKKAQRFGLPSINVLSTKESFWQYEQETSPNGSRVSTYLVSHKDINVPRITLLEIKLEHPLIKLGNWTVVGKKEVLDTDAMLQLAFTEVEADKAYLSKIAESPICCEHCKTNRNRKESFLLRNEDNAQYTEIGSTCLEDYTGIDPSGVLNLAKMYSTTLVDDFPSETYGSSNAASSIDTLRFLSVTQTMIKNFGFTSSRTSKETGVPSTASEALSALFSRNTEILALLEDCEQTSTQYAKQAREWALASQDTTPYFLNLKSVLSQEMLPLKNHVLALAASALPQYHKHLAQAVDKANSEHVGTTKVRMESELKIKGLYNYETRFGPKTIVSMQDNSGNVIKWATSACPSDFTEAYGKAFKAAFTVKEHGTNQRIKETWITRLSVIEWLENGLSEVAKPEPEQRELKNESSYPFANRVDTALEQDWSLFTPSNHQEPIDILRDYAEQACMSGDQLTCDTFKNHTFMSPSDFYQHSEDIHRVYTRIEQERSEQDAKPTNDVAQPESEWLNDPESVPF